MLFSLAVAFMVTPWAAARIFRRRARGTRQAARGLSDPAVSPCHDLSRRRPSARWAFLAWFAILAGAVALVAAGLVKVKLLPFDNKSEFQVMIDHDAGTPSS